MTLDELKAMTDDELNRIVAIIKAERRGRIAGMEEAAKICWAMSDELGDRDDMTSEQGMAQHCAAAIRARIAKLKEKSCAAIRAAHVAALEEALEIVRTAWNEPVVRQRSD